MAVLTDEHKLFIVQALACHDTPSQVVAAVKDEFKITVTRQQVESYNCTRAAGKNTAQKWAAIFNKTREDFEAEISKIPVALRAVRLRRLQRYVDMAEQSGNLVLAAQLLEQIAKEQGGMYDNRRIHVHSGPNGGAIQTENLNVNLNMTEEEADRRIAELQSKLDAKHGQ
ncbi:MULTISPECIES: DUF2280 domain-containing protein [Acinetobacter]|mgnify:FL=1|uniref:DUF2280 domain-containing protein n=1 Tax=Acinetobacter corruptisaponis TaxID=3045147 RepID=A0ABY8S3X3_9GAMM|nr:DUF2280 domain-containing protein [Acinetobacter sp. KCTC 92772]WHP05778.1 DUF2280 domain-containing protein [Acinetobacter sp. KCTC 92772]